MNIRDYPTIPDFLRHVMRGFDIEPPYSISAGVMAHYDAFEIIMSYDPYHEAKTRGFYFPPGRRISYVRTEISREALHTDIKSVYLAIGLGFKQLQSKVHYRENFFRALHPLTRHIGGHPLEHTLNLDFNTV